MPDHMANVRWWPESVGAAKWLGSYLLAHRSGSHTSLSSQLLGVNVESCIFIAPLAL